MATAVRNNGLQALGNANHHLDMNMKPVECLPKEEATETETGEPTPEIDIVISNVVCSFSVRCHLNLREIALKGSNVEYKREHGVS